MLLENRTALSYAIIIFVNFAVFVLILTSKLPVPLPFLSFILNLTTATLFSTGLIPRTLGPTNVFILLNGWICLHHALD